MVFTKDLLRQGFRVYRIEKAAGLHQVGLLLLCSVGSTIVEDELVDGKLLISPTEKPNSLGLVLRGLFNRLPYVTLIYVDLTGLGKVEVSPPGVAVVADELNWLQPRTALLA